MHPNDTTIPYGYCHCGCGQKTRLHTQNAPDKSFRKGEPRRFLQGHSRRKHPHGHTVDPKTGCWNWNGATENGYGRTGRKVNDPTWDMRAHRMMYKKLVGPIPEGLELDHTCRNRRCVNPAHLEPVTRIENLRRAGISKLTEEDVREIRSLSLDGLPKSKIARMFSLSHSTVWEIINRKIWKHVP